MYRGQNYVLQVAIPGIIILFKEQQHHIWKKKYGIRVRQMLVGEDGRLGTLNYMRGGEG
jgi:hypothetical protein